MTIRAPRPEDFLAPLPLVTVFGLLVIAFWGTVMVHQYRRMFALEQTIHLQRDEIVMLREQYESLRARADHCCLCSMPSTSVAATR